MGDTAKGMAIAVAVIAVMGYGLYAWNDLQRQHEDEVMNALDRGYGEGRYEETQALLGEIDVLAETHVFTSRYEREVWNDAVERIRSAIEKDADEYYHHSDAYGVMMDRQIDQMIPEEEWP